MMFLLNKLFIHSFIHSKQFASVGPRHFMVQLVRSVKLSKRKQNVWTLDRLENVDKIKRMSILARLSKNLLPGPDRSINTEILF